MPLNVKVSSVDARNPFKLAIEKRHSLLLPMRLALRRRLEVSVNRASIYTDFKLPEPEMKEAQKKKAGPEF